MCTLDKMQEPRQAWTVERSLATVQCLRRLMTTEDERCARARKWQRLDDAFREGNLEAVRAAVEDPSIIPNGTMPFDIGSCLVYAIYLSPLSFIRTLLELGADPNAPVDDGFPPLIAALSSGRHVPGTTPRTDVDDVLRLLLSFGADPNQRGINDYTPLHMAVADRNLGAMDILLSGGADPALRTRIDECETPLEMARTAGLTEIVEVLERNGRPLNRRLRSGLVLLADLPGAGEQVRRGQRYLIRLKLWLHQGDAVRWKTASGPVGSARLEDEGTTLITEVRIDRRSIVNGLFYGIEGMRVGGRRRLEIAPHLGYGDRGVPGVIPPNALLLAEITVLEPRSSG
jgi:ankyrin repeat protein